MSSVQEHQASVGADISTLQSQLADLVQQVICNAGEADAKPQRRADALSAAAGTIEALQRLLPASGQPAGQPVLDGRAGELAEAATQQLAGLGSTPGKVEPRNVRAGCSAFLNAWQEARRLFRLCSHTGRTRMWTLEKIHLGRCQLCTWCAGWQPVEALGTCSKKGSRTAQSCRR
jgi:hypothetical protein